MVLYSVGLKFKRTIRNDKNIGAKLKENSIFLEIVMKNLKTVLKFQEFVHFSKNELSFLQVFLSFRY